LGFFPGFIGHWVCWFLWGLSVLISIAKCYSHQLNPEMENDCAVFIMFIASVQEQC